MPARERKDRVRERGGGERLITFLNFYLWHSWKRLGVTHTLIIHGSAALRRRGRHYTGSSGPKKLHCIKESHYTRPEVLCFFHKRF